MPRPNHVGIPHTLSRRACLGAPLFAFATGSMTPSYSRDSNDRNQAARAKACILLFMDGGASQIDTFDLKPEAPAEIRGPYASIATTVPGIRVCEHWPLLAQQMHRILQIRSVRHTETVHDPAVYQMLTGWKHISSAGGLMVEETDMPHMGSAFAAADPVRTPMPRFVETPDKMRMQARILPGQNAGVLPRSFDPFFVEVTRDGTVVPPNFNLPPELTTARVGQRADLVDNFNRQRTDLKEIESARRIRMFREQAADILSSSAQEAFRLDRESPETRDRYGRHRHGQSVLLARRLVEAGSRFVTVYWGNEEQDWADGKGPKLANNPWDTHRNHFPLCTSSLFPRADQTLSALIDDLANRGRLDETLVVWMGDFGRTPYISKPWASRDHWPHAFTILMAGAGIRASHVFGRTDKHAAEVTDNPISPADITATIFYGLGIETAGIQGASKSTPLSERPHRISVRVPTARGGSQLLSNGRVLNEFFA